MIEVEHLTKRYGDLIAVNDISFSLEEGDIVGFLGPNGAGKSTTMKIITGCLAADSGSVRIAGYDILKKPKEAKRFIGYLPEVPPLYDEMTVSAYLDYVADLKDVSRKRKKFLKDMVIQECGLERVYRRLIKHLSKGYRQRVGIAQAIINDPAILILDEPTIGLDPKQVKEIRELIKGLTGKRTVILSTHIIYEVTMICQRVIIINEGKIAAMDTLDNLTSEVGKTRLILRLKEDKEDLSYRLKQIEGVKEVSREDSYYYIEHLPGERDKICDQISKIVLETGNAILELRSERMSLEDIFVKIVTREQR
jgi:ABC-2 type transport system ATP-binding protein